MGTMRDRLFGVPGKPQLRPSLGVRLNALKKTRTAMQKTVPRWEYKVEALHGAQAEQCKRG